MNGAHSGSFFVERRAAVEGLASFVIESQLWVALAVTSLSAYAARELGIARPGPALLAVFFSTLFIYNLDTSLDLDKDPHSPRATRARWFALSAAVCLGVTLASGPVLPALVVLLGGGFCSLYAIPLGRAKFRLKNVPGTKSAFVGISVAAAVLLVPLAHAGEIPVAGARVLWLFALLVTLTTLNATLFDVRDLHQDRGLGLATLPVLIGESRTRALLLVFAALGFGLVLSCAPELHLEAMTCWIVCTVFCLVLSPRSPRAAYSLLVDGALFLPWLLG